MKNLLFGFEPGVYVIKFETNTGLRTGITVLSDGIIERESDEYLLHVMMFKGKTMYINQRRIKDMVKVMQMNQFGAVDKTVGDVISFGDKTEKITAVTDTDVIQYLRDIQESVCGANMFLMCDLHNRCIWAGGGTCANSEITAGAHYISYHIDKHRIENKGSFHSMPGMDSRWFYIAWEKKMNAAEVLSELKSIFESDKIKKK